MSMSGTPSSIAASSPAAGAGAGAGAGAAEAKAPKTIQPQSMDLEFIIGRWCYFYGKLETPTKKPGQFEWFALDSSELLDAGGNPRDHISKKKIADAENYPWLQRNVVPNQATPLSLQTSPVMHMRSEAYNPPANNTAHPRTDTEEHKWSATTTHRADYQHSLTRRRQIKTSSEIKLESAPVAFSAAIEAAWTNTTADSKTDTHSETNHHEVKRSVPVEIPAYSQCTVTHTLTQQEETRTYQSEITLSGSLMVCAKLMSHIPKRGLFHATDGKWHRKKLVSIRELFNDFDRWHNNAALNGDERNTIDRILNTTTRPDGTDTVVCQSTQTVITTVKKESIIPKFSLLPNAPAIMPASAEPTTGQASAAAIAAPSPAPHSGGLDYQHDGVVAGGAAVVADFGDDPSGRSAEELATIAKAYPGGVQIHEDNISAAGNVTKAKLPFSQALQNPALATMLLNAALQAATHAPPQAETTSTPAPPGKQVAAERDLTL